MGRGAKKKPVYRKDKQVFLCAPKAAFPVLTGFGNERRVLAAHPFEGAKKNGDIKKITGECPAKEGQPGGITSHQPFQCFGVGDHGGGPHAKIGNEVKNGRSAEAGSDKPRRAGVFQNEAPEKDDEQYGHIYKGMAEPNKPVVILRQKDIVQNEAAHPHGEHRN